MLHHHLNPMMSPLPSFHCSRLENVSSADPLKFCMLVIDFHACRIRIPCSIPISRSISITHPCWSCCAVIFIIIHKHRVQILIPCFCWPSLLLHTPQEKQQLSVLVVDILHHFYRWSHPWAVQPRSPLWTSSRTHRAHFQQSPQMGPVLCPRSDAAMH